MTTNRPPELDVGLAENPEPRCACVLLLDTSGSMKGNPIKELNKGLQTFKDVLMKDDVAPKRVEVAVVTFDGSVKVVQDFVTVDGFEPPELTTGSLTFMGTAIHKALDMVEERKQQYRANGVKYFRPWVMLITDGEPQGEKEDVVARASTRIKDAERGKHVVFYAVAVAEADMARLEDIAGKPPLKLAGLKFVELFQWLSDSMAGVAKTKPGEEQLALPTPAGLLRA